MVENNFTTFTENDMYGLLEIYDAYEALIDAVKTIVGKDLAVSFSDGILGKLQWISDLIAKHSPMFDSDLDFTNQPFYEVLSNKEMDNHEKAKVLMGE